MRLGLALLSIGCAGHSEREAETRCDWGVLSIASPAWPGPPCEWSALTLDASVARIRSLAGHGSAPLPTCGIITYEHIAGLAPGDTVEVWSPRGTPNDVAWPALDLSGCE